MGSRLDLQNILVATLGANRVYFQPPESLQMSYPCIRYERSQIVTKSANNQPYLLGKRYTVTVITTDPDSPIPEKVAMLPQCKHDRHFAVDNLYHDVFTLQF